MKFRKNQADGTMGILSVAVIRTYERGTNPLFREALVLFRVAIGIAVNFRIPGKANGICFRKWLEDVLPRLNSTPAGQIDSLIPGGKQSCQ